MAEWRPLSEPARVRLAAALGVLIVLVYGLLFAQERPAGSTLDARAAV